MNRQEWLKWRQGGIGSSDAPIILGVSEWSTQLKLWEEKLATEPKEDDSNSFIKRIGNETEPKVRALFEILQGKSFSPKLIQDETFPWLRASLDGCSEDNSEILEIKLLGKLDWNYTRSGRVPEKYMPQVQHQLRVSGAKKCWFVAHLYKSAMSADNLAIIEVGHDIPFQTRLFEEEFKFWDLVQKKKPPVPMAGDYKKLKGKGLTAAASKFKRLKQKAEALESELEEVRSTLLCAARSAGHPRLMLGDLKFLEISRVGNVDYKKIPELQGVDLEQYRGKGSTSWRIDV